jgi:hypothetical protein
MIVNIIPFGNKTYLVCTSFSCLRRIIHFLDSESILICRLPAEENEAQEGKHT